VRQLESVRPGLLAHLVDAFARNAGEFLAAVDGHVATGARETLRIGFHSMKGTAANLGARRLSHIAGLAEHSVAAGEKGEALAALVQALKREFESTREALSQAAART
jgi:HPt (histidine-containing phosphotransfer) domain-containing protein